MFIEMLKTGIPIADGDNVYIPSVGDVIEVSNAVGTALIRGKDGKQSKAAEVAAAEVAAAEVVAAEKSSKKSPKNKSFGAAPENK